MLGSQKLIAFMGTRDPVRAKHFYRDTLGLHLVSEDEFALVFDASGIMLRVTRVQELAAAKYAVLGWQVHDIVLTAKRLPKDARYAGTLSGMQQDELGIWDSAKRREGSLVERPRWKHVEYHAVLSQLDLPP